MRVIPAGNALAIVDDEDYERLSRWKWHLDSDGYVRRNYRKDGKKTTLTMHREVMGLGPGDGGEVDHRNRNKLDNRRENLRLVSHAANTRNRGSRRGSRSRHRGVTWFAPNQKWMVRAMVNGRSYFGGYFDDEEEAGRRAVSLREEVGCST